MKVEPGLWQPVVDMYESGEAIILYYDLAGVLKDSLELLVEEHQVHISGRRHFDSPQGIVCIHQLEIEQGPFARTVELPVFIDVEQSSSSYQDGVLVVFLRKKKKLRNQITVRIKVGS